MQTTFIIFVKDGMRRNVGYKADKKTAMKMFHKEYGYPKILFIQENWNPMANLTRAERHNRMLETTFNHYRKHQESLPPCELYARFLEIAVEKLEITIDEARSKYGHYTVQQWETLLKLGWNK